MRGFQKGPAPTYRTYPPLVRSGFCLVTPPRKKLTCPAKRSTLWYDRGRRTGLTTKTPLPRPRPDMQLFNSRELPVLLGSGKSNLRDPGFFHQLVKATLGEFNWLLQHSRTTFLFYFQRSLLQCCPAFTLLLSYHSIYFNYMYNESTSHVSFMGQSHDPSDPCQAVNSLTLCQR